MDFTLFYYIGAIALVMIANTLFGIAKAQNYDEFDYIIANDDLAKTKEKVFKILEELE